jgi:putative heme iron utilization protein
MVNSDRRGPLDRAHATDARSPDIKPRASVILSPPREGGVFRQPRFQVGVKAGRYATESVIAKKAKKKSSTNPSAFSARLKNPHFCALLIGQNRAATRDDAIPRYPLSAAQ